MIKFFINIRLRLLKFYIHDIILYIYEFEGSLCYNEVVIEMGFFRG